MQERKQFNVLEPAFHGGEHSIDLTLGERMAVPFTGGEIVYSITNLGEKVVIKKPSNNYEARHEWDGLNRTWTAGVSVPTPIALINFTADQLAIVSGFIEGDNLYYTPNPSIKPQIGEQVRKMHQNIQVDGNIWESSGRNSFAYYDRYIFNWARGSLQELRTDTNTAKLLNELTDAAEQFCSHEKPVFNHNDLHDGQIIVNRQGAPIVIDFGNWTEETWMNDIGYYLFHLVRTGRAGSDDFANFLSGYKDNKELSDSEKTNLAFYLLFISSRALNYFYKSGSSYLPIAKETHKKVLAYLEDESLWRGY